MLAFFVLAILTSFFGTPAGNRNFAIIFVWIVWWALVIILMVPALGRGWCAICPIPAPGEWMQRQSFVHPRRRKLWTLGKRWPRQLKNIWLQNISFLMVALFSAIILTRPAATGIVLLAFILVAMGLSLVYERRTFCRYVCPVGGFIGLYSMAAPIELRVKDIDVCRTHDSKDCYLGNEHGFGCPWMVFPGSLQRNTHCGLCTECMKTCTMDNVAVNLRLPGLDFFVAKQRRMDEAYKAFIMLACALAYSVVLLGPWGLLKDAANFVRIDWWLLYAAGFLALNLLIVPGIFFLAAAASRKLGDFRQDLRPHPFYRPLLQPYPAGPGRLDRLQPRLRAGQHQLRPARHCRSLWLGLESVRAARHALDAHRSRPRALSPGSRPPRRSRLRPLHALAHSGRTHAGSPHPRRPAPGPLPHPRHLRLPLAVSGLKREDVGDRNARHYLTRDT